MKEKSLSITQATCIHAHCSNGLALARECSCRCMHSVLFVVERECVAVVVSVGETQTCKKMSKNNSVYGRVYMYIHVRTCVYMYGLTPY